MLAVLAVGRALEELFLTKRAFLGSRAYDVFDIVVDARCVQDERYIPTIVD